MIFSAFGAEEKEAVLMLSTGHPNNVPFVATFNGELYLRHNLLGKKSKCLLYLILSFIHFHYESLCIRQHEPYKCPPSVLLI